MLQHCNIFITRTETHTLSNCVFSEFRTKANAFTSKVYPEQLCSAEQMCALRAHSFAALFLLVIFILFSLLFRLAITGFLLVANLITFLHTFAVPFDWNSISFICFSIFADIYIRRSLRPKFVTMHTHLYTSTSTLYESNKHTNAKHTHIQTIVL